MTAEVHFVQGGEAPILLGSGDEVLSCACGNALIERFQASQFIGVSIQCGRCHTISTTNALEDGRMPPPVLITAEPSTEPRTAVMTVPAGVAVAGRAEMDRLGNLLRPATPDWTYHFNSELLDRALAAFERHAGRPLPEIAPEDPSDHFKGLRDHALAWSVRHLRTRMQAGSWTCTQDAPTANAVTHVAGFLHFVAAWSAHPLFPVMMATADDRGFSLHGLALFAGAHALAMMGNRIGFREPAGFPRRIEDFDLATGPTETFRVHLDVFDRFEFPFGRAWDHASLRTAVQEVVAAAQGRINMRNPGLLLLSPGTALAGYDEALIEAIKLAMQAHGRKNRGLVALAPIVLRLQALADPHAIQIGYGLFPVTNRHQSGDFQLRTGQ